MLGICGRQNRLPSCLCPNYWNLGLLPSMVKGPLQMGLSGSISDGEIFLDYLFGPNIVTGVLR